MLSGPLITVGVSFQLACIILEIWCHNWGWQYLIITKWNGNISLSFYFYLHISATFFSNSMKCSACDAWTECKSFPKSLLPHYFLSSTCIAEWSCQKRNTFLLFLWVLSDHFCNYFCSLSRSFWISALSSCVPVISPWLYIIFKLILTLNIQAQR